MKVITFSAKVTLVRHWGVWYRVQRGAEDWRKLKIAPYQKPKSIAAIAKAIEKGNNKRYKQRKYHAPTR